MTSGTVQAQVLPPGGHEAGFTTTLSTAAHHAAASPSHYTVRSGDSLSAIAGRIYHNPALWPALWWVNKATIANPNAVEAGQVLKLSSWHPQEAWLASAAMHAIPAPPPPPRPVVVTVSQQTASSGYQPQQAAPAYHAVSYSGGGYGNVSPGSYGGYKACVIARESGGNSQVMNGSGHYGLFQFSAPTWAAYGGNPAVFGHATVAEQNAVFNAAMATAGGASNWTPSDGC